MKTVIITGGSSEIGESSAREFAKRGYQIVLTYYQNEEKTRRLVETLKQEYNVEAYAFYCNLQEESSIISMVDNVKRVTKSIDCLVNNAAVCYDSLYSDKNKSRFMETLEVNVVGTFLISKLVGEEMYQNKSGVIINLSSTNGISQYFPMSIDYDASKAALISLTHNLSIAYSPYVRVNAVAPGFIGTKKELEGMDEEFIKMEEEKISLKRYGKPEEVAKVIYFLASEEASYVNNSILEVDGGMR